MSAVQSSMAPDIFPVLKRDSPRLFSKGTSNKCESGSWEMAKVYAASASAKRPSLNMSYRTPYAERMQRLQKAGQKSLVVLGALPESAWGCGRDLPASI
jgi:hypothetical protein